MTRKDYVAFATAIEASTATADAKEYAAQIAASVFSRDNTAFSLGQFLKACGLYEGRKDIAYVKV